MWSMIVLLSIVLGGCAAFGYMMWRYRSVMAERDEARKEAKAKDKSAEYQAKRGKIRDETHKKIGRIILDANDDELLRQWRKLFEKRRNDNDPKT